MNYLAHAFLSPDDPLILMGNLWGDLIKPKDAAQLHESVIKGVQLHKAIDAFTDQHEGVNEIVHLLRSSQGKYTPVVVDVLMDFILSKFWNNYHDDDLVQYCQSVYHVVDTYLHFIPDRLHVRIGRMYQNRWLESCAGRERMVMTLQMLSKRASFENNIPAAMGAYDLHQQHIDALFIQFFDDLVSHISLRNED